MPKTHPYPQDSMLVFENTKINFNDFLIKHFEIFSSIQHSFSSCERMSGCQQTSNDLFFKKLKLIIDSCSVYIRKSLLIGHNYNITNSSSRSFSISLEA